MKWVPIKLEGRLFEVTSCGKVREQCGFIGVNPVYRKTSPVKSGKGFFTIILRDKHRHQRNYYVHRLIADHFVSNPNNYSFIRFKDGNIQNINSRNLEWVRLPTDRKLTEKTVLQIKSFIKRGETIRNIAEIFNVSTSTVYMIKRGERWA